ncbi:MAG: MBL fold metallo-hydrolase [Patescibacteria group bacterium]
MDITYLGHSSFRLRGKNASLVTDPFDPKMVGFKFPKVSADIVTVSHDHGDHNQAEIIGGVNKVIKGPGEYEISGVSVIGISTFHDDNKGSLRGKNTVYVIEMDRLRIAHLGDLGHKFSESVREEMGDIDILMIPVGGEYTISPATAGQITRDIEPNICLPMHYQMRGLDPKTFAKLEGVDQFLNDLGLPVERLDKLSVKKESLGEEQKVVVLNKK